MNKKGQGLTLGGLLPVIITLAILVLFSTFLADVTETVRQTSVEDTASILVDNETVSIVGLLGTQIPLSNNGPHIASLTCLAVNNNRTGLPNATGPAATANRTINAGNWSCDTGGFTIFNRTSYVVGGTNNGFDNLTAQVQVTYSFTPATSAFNVSSQGLAGNLALSEQFGNLGTVFAIVIMIGILIGIIVLFTGRGGI